MTRRGTLKVQTYRPARPSAHAYGRKFKFRVHGSGTGTASWHCVTGVITVDMDR